MTIIITQADNGYVILMTKDNKHTYFVAGDIVQAVEIVNDILRSDIKPTPMPH